MEEPPFDFVSGDRVTFQDGPFSRFDANVVEIDTTARMIHLSIPIFGRENPISLDFDTAARILEHAE